MYQFGTVLITKGFCCKFTSILSEDTKEKRRKGVEHMIVKTKERMENVVLQYEILERKTHNINWLDLPARTFMSGITRKQ